VLAGNSLMLELLRRFGDTKVVNRAAGVVELQIELRGAGSRTVSPTRARRCARTA